MTYQKLKVINNFRILVIMMIDGTHEEIIEKYLELGIKDCVVKPIKKDMKEVILKSFNID